MYGLSQKLGKVTRVIEKRKNISQIEVEVENDLEQAINYRKLTGDIEVEDQVILNTTAVELRLGTGGYHFVIANISQLQEKGSISTEEKDKGHIMKLRYTPFQTKTLSVEEPVSRWHDIFKKNKSLASLNKFPVILIPLHSLLAPVLTVFKSLYPDKKAVYIMSEGGALILELSNLVARFKEKDYLDSTITVGQAVGGDLEAVNIFTGLIAARKIVNADLIIIGMGPGITGTATTLGFSGIENVFISQAIDLLEGKTIFVPRVSLAEKRSRHYIISHHTVTLLENLIKNRIEVIFPAKKKILKEINNTDIPEKHEINYYEQKQINKVKNILINSDFEYKSMGRYLEDDPLFFIIGGLAVLRYKSLIEE